MGNRRKIIETYVKERGKVYRVWRYRSKSKVYWQETPFKRIPFILINNSNKNDPKIKEELKKIKSYQNNKTTYKQKPEDTKTQLLKRGF